MQRSLIILALLFVVYILLLATAGFWANWFWFDSFGLGRLVWLRAMAPLALGLSVGVVAGLVALVNLLVAARGAGPRQLYRGQLQPLPQRALRLLVWAASIGVGLILGLTAAPRWETLLLAANAPPFGMADPIFGLDASFYVFILPVLNAVRGWLIELVILVTIAVTGLYILQTGASLRQGQIRIPPSLRAHLALLGSLLLLLIAAGYWTGAFEVLYARRGAVAGAGYADVAAQLPAYQVLLVVAVAAAVGLVVYLLTRRLVVLIVSVAAWPLAALLGQIYPTVVQNLVVRPNEQSLETPYIEHNIRMTRYAFGLDEIDELTLSGRGTLTADDLRVADDTVNNLRLWDVRPLLATYVQTQEIRLYYTFTDVDVDRYRVGDRYRQVMIAARELDQAQLSQQAQTWQNRHLVYTHGFGVVASPVNEQRAEGLPTFFLENIPPTGVPELALTQPRIYFGEKTDAYVFVRTLPTRPGEGPEFDYPLGDGNATYSYTGRDGVRLDSPLKRLILAAYFGDPNVVFSRTFTDETRVLYHRTLQERLGRLAPFLKLDRDPYITVIDGRLVWIQDAYTTTDRFPYSTTTVGGGALGRVNYVRNPVKITVDAYDGTVTAYVIDPTEPILLAYQRIYPELFRPIEEAPAALRQHFRYPEDLFNLQSEVYTTYHMRNPQVFYNREDAWAVPTLTADGRATPLDAYYVVMNLPEATTAAPEYMLIRPFTPLGKANMVAWLAGRSDGAEYGKLRVYTFPKDRVLFGPQQIDARINQDPEISSQLTLWDQRGSQVLRGNLLVVPIRDTLLYVQPLYLQAENSKLPELTRVIVASSERVAMGTDLASALERLVQARPGGVTALPAPARPPATPPAGQPPAATLSPEEMTRLAQQARDQYRRAQEALQRGDWAGYGAALKELEATLDRLAGGR